MTILESDLQFKFDDTFWWVKKYDSHPYYKRLSGAGLKGMDLIGIYKQEKLVFIEIKNFRNKHPSRQEPFKVLNETEVFIDDIADKLEDTFKAIVAINEYLHKKWWYRILTATISRIPHNWLFRQDWLFWHLVNQFIHHKPHIQFILWLEIEEGITEEEMGRLSEHIDKTLEIKLEEFIDEVIVANTQTSIYKDSLQVTFFIKT